MTPDELRALADALDRLKFRCDGIDDACLVEDAADYLRACADAKPVAWMQSDHIDIVSKSPFMCRCAPTQQHPDYVPLYAHPAPAVPAGWKLVPVEPTPEMLASTLWPGCAGTDYAHMLAAAPAVPAIEERGPWSAGQDKQQPWEQRVWIESDDFTHDVRLYVNGDFESNDQRIAYAQEIARRLNAAPTAPAGWKWVPVEPTPEMLSAVGMMDGYDWHAPGCSPDADHANWYSAMIAAAPAAPQAEPKEE